MTDPGPADVGHLLRDLAPRVLGAVARRHGDFAAAEDAVQEALMAAAERWPRAGVPANPGGWLHHVALRRLTDHLRSEMARRRREDAVAREVWAEWAFVPPPDADPGMEEDDGLVLLFMCCHPALTPSSAVALTLRAVGGLTTAEIARAFLVPEATLAQRVSRAKRTIRDSGIPFSMPEPEERGARLVAVRHVLYLVFNEGYTASAGPDLHRPDLAREAVRLTRSLLARVPDDPEVAGLLALMLLTDARRPARTGPGGELVPLDEQDRSVWDRDAIAEGMAVASAALVHGAVGPFQLQAAIAAAHAAAPTAADTDWGRILALYDLLGEVAPGPMVSLGRVVALAMVRGPEAGLEALDALEAEGGPSGHRPDAVRAHLLERAGRPGAAVRHYRAAAEGTASAPERDYLRLKAARAAARAAGPAAEKTGG